MYMLRITVANSVQLEQKWWGLRRYYSTYMKQWNIQYMRRTANVNSIIALIFNYKIHESKRNIIMIVQCTTTRNNVLFAGRVTQWASHHNDVYTVYSTPRAPAPTPPSTAACTVAAWRTSKLQLTSVHR